MGEKMQVLFLLLAGVIAAALVFVIVSIAIDERIPDCEYGTSEDGSRIILLRPAEAQSCSLELEITYSHDEGWKTQPDRQSK